METDGIGTFGGRRLLFSPEAAVWTFNCDFICIAG
jgi:hypothetical protein